MENDVTYQSWDNTYYDINYQFYQKGGAGKRELHNYGCGNVKFLEEWTEDFLPQFIINIDQPWFYSMHTTKAFPILYKSSLTKAEHIYTIREKITELLRFQKYDEKEQTWVDFLPQNPEKLITSNSKIDISPPELWGRYVFITDNELKWMTECRDCMHYYIRDIVVHDDASPKQYGMVSTIKLSTPTPCLAMFWVAENTLASKLHNYSNYTTNASNLYAGWDPIKSNTLTYGGKTSSKKLSNMPSDHFSISECRYHFPSAPNEVGYHAYSFCGDSTSHEGEPGIIFTPSIDATLICTIENNDIFNYNDSDEIVLNNSSNNQTGPSYIVKCRLLVIRKLTIVRSENKFDFVIE
jgi:hypothetical protein